MNRLLLSNADDPRGIVKREAIAVTVFGQRITLMAIASNTHVCAAVERLNAVAAGSVGVEVGADVPPLPADIQKHAPVAIIAAARTIRIDSELVQRHFERAHGNVAAAVTAGVRIRYVVPPEQDALSEEVRVGSREGQDDAQPRGSRRDCGASRLRLVRRWCGVVDQAD